MAEFSEPAGREGGYSESRDHFTSGRIVDLSFREILNNSAAVAGRESSTARGDPTISTRRDDWPLIMSLTALAVLAVAACGFGFRSQMQLGRQGQSAPLAQCATLASTFSYAATAITASSVVTAGTLTNAGQPVGEHCLVTGKIKQRVSSVDGQTYAIGFEMRMPKNWNGRFLYQGNGGTDGLISQAIGAFSGGGPLQNALQQGFAVISSDAGHTSEQNPLFGLDAQARLDYGYMAVGSLTPMAKTLIKGSVREPTCTGARDGACLTAAQKAACRS